MFEGILKVGLLVCENAPNETMFWCNIAYGLLKLGARNLGEGVRSKAPFVIHQDKGT